MFIDFTVRRMGRGEREREIDRLSPIQAPNGDGTCDLGI